MNSEDGYDTIYDMENLRTYRILAYLKAKKSCSLKDLMKKFHVSSATIHRDVEALARRDAVERVRGGIVFNESADTGTDLSNFRERVVSNRAEKIAAARMAVPLVQDGDIIFLDSSTTTFELALLLMREPIDRLTIITNSVAIMGLFRKMPATWVKIALGGSYDAQLNSILGAAALSQLAGFNITKAFVSAFGVDAKNVTTNHEHQAELLRVVLDSADKRYLVVGHSKLGRTGLYRLSARGGFDAILTN